MWTSDTRGLYDRSKLRYPSDVTDAEWALIEPLIRPAKHGGRKRSVNMREVVNGLFHVLETSCPWSDLLKDLPPKSTVHDYFDLWSWDDTLERMHDALHVALREPRPSVAILDSQSARSAQKGGADRPGGFRCRKEGHGHEAPGSHRQPRPDAGGGGPSGERAGP